MKPLIRIVLVIAVMATSTGCALFKKKCDCPSFGKAAKEEPLAAEPKATQEPIAAIAD